METYAKELAHLCSPRYESLPFGLCDTLVKCGACSAHEETMEVEGYLAVVCHLTVPSFLSKIPGSPLRMSSEIPGYELHEMLSTPPEKIPLILASKPMSRSSEADKRLIYKMMLRGDLDDYLI